MSFETPLRLRSVAPQDERREIVHGARRAMKDELMKKQLDPALLAELERLAALPDSMIDLSDIPELPKEVWRNARRPGLERLGREALRKHAIG